MLTLDSQNRLLRVHECFRGTLAQTSVYPREIVKLVLQDNAAAVIFAHNHPSGVAEPSRADELLTQTLKQALALVDVKVLDHFVVAGRSRCRLLRNVAFVALCSTDLEGMHSLQVSPCSWRDASRADSPVRNPPCRFIDPSGDGAAPSGVCRPRFSFGVHMKSGRSLVSLAQELERQLAPSRTWSCPRRSCTATPTRVAT